MDQNHVRIDKNLALGQSYIVTGSSENSSFEATSFAVSFDNSLSCGLLDVTEENTQELTTPQTDEPLSNLLVPKPINYIADQINSAKSLLSKYFYHKEQEEERLADESFASFYKACRLPLISKLQNFARFDFIADKNGLIELAIDKTFEKVELKAESHFSFNGPLYPWLIKVAIRTYKDVVRKERGYRSHILSEEEAHMGIRDAIDPDDQPLDYAILTELTNRLELLGEPLCGSTIEIVTKHIERISNESIRETARLYFLEEIDSHKIARMLEEKPATIRKRIPRLKNQLLEVLRELVPFAGEVGYPDESFKRYDVLFGKNNYPNPDSIPETERPLDKFLSKVISNESDSIPVSADQKRHRQQIRAIIDECKAEEEWIFADHI